MGFLSKLLNPLEHLKDAKRGIKALKKGDYMGALDPANVLHQPLPQAQAAAAKAPNQPFMGAAGPTLKLGSSTGGRSYTPNPFASQGGAMMLRPAVGGASAGQGAPMPNPAAVSPSSAPTQAPPMQGSAPVSAPRMPAQARQIAGQKQLAMMNALRAGAMK